MVTRLLCAAVFAVFRDVFADSSHVETGSHYTQYIPGKYSDYVPEMDESGIKYQKYMQGQPDAMKFQEKVLPEGDYQHYIPLSQNGKADKHDALEVVLAAAKSEKKEDRKDRKTKDTDDSAERANGEMDFEKYMRAPTPGPVVDRKYGKYIPGKYSDYVPEMDESGIKYQKYMPESSGDSNRAGSFSRSNAAHEEILAETWNPSWMLAMFTMASGAVVLASVFARRPSPTPLGLQQPLTADDQQV